jgi:hypothetical protein
LSDKQVSVQKLSNDCGNGLVVTAYGFERYGARWYCLSQAFWSLCILSRPPPPLLPGALARALALALAPALALALSLARSLALSLSLSLSLTLIPSQPSRSRARALYAALSLSLSLPLARSPFSTLIPSENSCRPCVMQSCARARHISAHSATILPCSLG